MNIPEIKAYEEKAVDTVVSVLNRAKEKLGERLTLRDLAKSRRLLSPQSKVSLSSLRTPLAATSAKLIQETIEKTWKLTDTLMYMLKYRGGSHDECSHYYYFEVIFSQPTISYPIPQATVSVFFRVKDKYVETVESKGAPTIIFRIEGQNTEHDIRYVKLTADWILAVLQMKIKLFQRIEELRVF